VIDVAGRSHRISIPRQINLKFDREARQAQCLQPSLSPGMLNWTAIAGTTSSLPPVAQETRITGTFNIGWSCNPSLPPPLRRGLSHDWHRIIRQQYWFLTVLPNSVSVCREKGSAGGSLLCKFLITQGHLQLSRDSVHVWKIRSAYTLPVFKGAYFIR